MRKIYSSIIMLTMMVTVCCFTACSSSSDDNNNGNSDNPLPINKRLSKVTHTIGSTTYEYIYDNQGRLIQCKTYYYYTNKEDIIEKIQSTYIYESNSIIETVYYDENTSWHNIYTMENGRIVKAYDEDTEETATFIYDNGYLITETEFDSTKKREFKYVWSDGNLMEIYENNKVRYAYEYTSYTCPQGFFPFGKNTCRKWGMSGYLGVSMKNLPSKYSEDSFVKRYDWTIKDGLPIKMVQHGDVVTDSDPVYTFEWK